MTTQPDKSNTLYARLPAELMDKVRAYRERQGITLSAAAAELIRRGLRPRGSYEEGWTAGFAAAIGLVDLVTNAGEHAARITEFSDQISALIAEARGES